MKTRMTFKDFAVSLVILTVLSILAVGWWNGKLSPTPRPSPSPTVGPTTSPWPGPPAVILSGGEESPGPTPSPTPSPVILSASEESPGPSTEPGVTYVLNLNTKKFHYPDCPSVEQIKPKNREDFTGSREEVLVRGFDPCKNCNP